MQRAFAIWTLMGALSLPSMAGTLERAEAMEREYEAARKAWILKLMLAENQEEREKEARLRPDPVVAAKKIWTEIRPNLKEPWVVKPAAWLFRMAPELTQEDNLGNKAPVMAKELSELRDAMEQYHFKSPDIGGVCLGLARARDPKSMSFLDRLQREHPDRRIQGVAAICHAILLRDLSDEPEALAKRLSLIKKGIIESADVTIDGVSMAKLAEDELYVIRFLSKGREAPDLSGMGTGGESMTLSSYKDKVVVLLFWTATSPDHEALMEMVKSMRQRFTGKPFEVVGVCVDPKETLRRMQVSGEVTWPNFSDPERKLAEEYRVGIMPVAYVLDRGRRIHYAGAMGSFVELTASALLAEGR